MMTAVTQASPPPGARGRAKARRIQLVADAPTWEMPVVTGTTVQSAQHRSFATVQLPIIDQVEFRQTGELIREQVHQMHSSQGRAPDVVVLSLLRWLSVCSKANGYLVEIEGREAVVQLRWLPGLGDDEAQSLCRQKVAVSALEEAPL